MSGSNLDLLKSYWCDVQRQLLPDGLKTNVGCIGDMVCASLNAGISLVWQHTHVHMKTRVHGRSLKNPTVCPIKA